MEDDSNVQFNQNSTANNLPKLAYIPEPDILTIRFRE
jgi:hypothetical protein